MTNHVLLSTQEEIEEACKRIMSDVSSQGGGDVGELKCIPLYR